MITVAIFSGVSFSVEKREHFMDEQGKSMGSGSTFKHFIPTAGKPAQSGLSCLSCKDC